jgi:hypothetical protein
LRPHEASAPATDVKDPAAIARCPLHERHDLLLLEVVAREAEERTAEQGACHVAVSDGSATGGTRSRSMTSVTFPTM